MPATFQGSVAEGLGEVDLAVGKSQVGGAGLSYFLSNGHLYRDMIRPLDDLDCFQRVTGPASDPDH